MFLLLFQRFVLSFHHFELFEDLGIAQATLFMVPFRIGASKADMTVLALEIRCLSMESHSFVFLLMKPCVMVGAGLLGAENLLAVVATKDLLGEAGLHFKLKV